NWNVGEHYCCRGRIGHDRGRKCDFDYFLGTGSQSRASRESQSEAQLAGWKFIGVEEQGCASRAIAGAGAVEAEQSRIKAQAETKCVLVAIRGDCDGHYYRSTRRSTGASDSNDSRRKSYRQRR